MLETIQEYVPFKHSFVYFSSWIGSRYGRTKTADEENNEKNIEEENQEQDDTLSNKEVDIPEKTDKDEVSDSNSALPGMRIGICLYSRKCDDL